MGDIERLDSRLASLAREEGALRLRLGQLLEVIGRGAVFDLGFSSLGAYAVERCERSVRWAEGARCLARRLEALPELRRALAMGQASWSMAEVLARVVTPEDEGRWLEVAESRTVRQVGVLVAEALTARREAARGAAARAVVTAPLGAERKEVASETAAGAGGCEPPAAAAADAAGEGVAGSGRTEGAPRAASMGGGTLLPVENDSGNRESGSVEEFCILTCTVDREEAWLFEATRSLLEQLGERNVAAQCEALLAEAQGTLLASLPKGAIVEPESLQACDFAQRRWLEQLRRWREEAEAACEKDVLDELLSARATAAEPAGRPTVASEASLGISSLQHASGTALDREVRALAAALARHELELSRLVLQFHRADGWRRLGYATEAQYALERLGLCRSSFSARRKLALRLETLPGVAAAVGAAQIGVEAALQLVRIATPRTEAAWVERAQRRTTKHLREEVAAALTAVRVSGESDCLPPEDAEMADFQRLEQAVVSGRLVPTGQSASPFGPARAASAARGRSASSSGNPRPLTEPASEARRAWCVMLGSLGSWLEGGLQTSAAASSMGAAPRSSAGRVMLRLRMSREVYAWWRSLEAQARRWLPRGMSWLRFMCLCVWHAWGHLLGTDAAYGHIYIRDRFRCTVPVCNRRDVTPHHLQFRSAGGSDEPCNITSPCTWCHLCGVHGGSIRATGTADRIHWELGPKGSPCVVVQGRERVAA